MRYKLSLLKSVSLNIVWALMTAAIALAQDAEKEMNREQLQIEIKAALAKGENYKTWPLPLQKAYDQSLEALYTAYQHAAEWEIKQVNDILSDISEPSARKPLEQHLAQIARSHTDLKLKLSQVKQSSELSAEKHSPTPSNGANSRVKNEGVATKVSNAIAPQPQLERTVGKSNLLGNKAPTATGGVVPATDKSETTPSASPAKSTGKASANSDAKAEDKKADSTTSPNNNLLVNVYVKGTMIPVTDAIVQLIEVNGESKSIFPGVYEQTNKYGKAILPIADIPNATYQLVVQREKFLTSVQEKAFVKGDNNNPTTLYVSLIPVGDEYHRAILGFEQTGASSTKSRQNVFFDFFVSRPIFNRRLIALSPEKILSDPDKYLCDKEADKLLVDLQTNSNLSRQEKKEARETARVAGFKEGKSDPVDYLANKTVNTLNCFHPPRFRAWGDVRLSSVPNASQNVFKGFQANFSSTLTSAISQTEATQSVSFTTGLQYRLFTGTIGARRFEFHFAGGGGLTTPLSTNETIETFRIPSKTEDVVRYNNLVKRLRELSPTTGAGNNISFDESQLTGKENISFVLKERDRFFRNYYGGIRLETYHNDPTITRTPAIFDIMVGQDELVTGGRFRGSVLRLDGFYPLPLSNGNLLYLFGSANLALARVRNQDPLLLPSTDNTTTPFSAKTLVFPISAANKDIYRIGIGLNLFNLLNSSSSGQQK